MNAEVKRLSHVDLLVYNMRTQLNSSSTSKQTNIVYQNLPRILSLEDQQREKSKEQRREIHMNVNKEFFSNASNTFKCCVQNYWLSMEEVVLMDIHTAASLGDCGGIDAALARCENINYRSHFSGWTPLMFAASRNHLVAVKNLILNGANVCIYSKSYGRTALALAASGGSCETVAAIVNEVTQQRYGLDSWDIYGWTALMHAIYFGTVDTVKFLVQKGCNINVFDINGMTPLMIAIENMRDETVFTLLSAGADATATTKKGLTVLNYALRRECPEIVNMVEAANEFKSEWNNASIRAVILILAALGLRKHIPIFIEHNIDLNKFSQLTEDELRALGLTNMGPRKKVLLAVRGIKVQNYIPYV